MRKLRVASLLQTAPIPLGLAVGSFYLFGLAASAGLFGGLLAGCAGVVLAVYAGLGGVAAVALAVKSPEHRITVQATARRDEATGEWVASIPAAPAREGRGPTPEAALEALCEARVADLAQPA